MQPEEADADGLGGGGDGGVLGGDRGGDGGHGGDGGDEGDGGVLGGVGGGVAHADRLRLPGGGPEQQPVLIRSRLQSMSPPGAPEARCGTVATVSFFYFIFALVV